MVKHIILFVCLSVSTERLHNSVPNLAMLRDRGAVSGDAVTDSACISATKCSKLYDNASLISDSILFLLSSGNSSMATGFVMIISPNVPGNLSLLAFGIRPAREAE